MKCGTLIVLFFEQIPYCFLLIGVNVFASWISLVRYSIQPISFFVQCFLCCLPHFCQMDNNMIFQCSFGGVAAIYSLPIGASFKDLSDAI